MKEKTIKVLLFIYVCLLSINARGQFSGPGSGTLTSPYLITSANMLNEIHNDLTAHYKLACNIDLSKWIELNLGKNGWIPIGNEASPFTGSLDGNGFCINNLKCSRQNNVGLFGCTFNATIKDIKLNSVNITGEDNVGCLIGKSSDTQISNIYVDGNCVGKHNVGGIIGLIYNIGSSETDKTSEFDVSYNFANSCAEVFIVGDNCVGGLIGKIQISTYCKMNPKQAREETSYRNGYWYMNYNIRQKIDNCKFLSSVKGDDNIGGIVGYVDLSSKTYNHCTYTPTQVNYTYNYYTTAISETCIQNCVVLTTSSISGKSNVGGIIGATFGSKVDEIGTIYNHGYNAGPGAKNSVLIKQCTYNNDLFCQDDCAGGIIGYAHPEITGSISSCATGSNIQGKNKIGGIIGSGAFTIENCLSNGIVQGNSYIGGIVGSQGGSIEKCYFSGKIQNSGNYSGGICGGNSKSIAKCLVASDLITGVKYIGRICGGESKSTNNYANVSCILKSNGYDIDVLDDDNNGYSISIPNMKSKSLYQGLSWNFDSIWNINVGESFPFFRFQTQPVRILNIVNSDSLYLSGTCSDDGLLFIKNNKKKQNIYN